MRVAFLVLDLLGIAALILPFAHGYSPWDALWVPSYVGVMRIMALGGFLAVPILVSDFRQSVLGPPSRAEVWMTYGIALSSLHATLVVSVVFLPEGWTASASAWTATLVVAAICAFNVHRSVPHCVNAHVCLLLAYLPNATMALVGFREELNVGAYVCLAAILAYFGQAVIRTASGLRRARSGTTGSRLAKEETTGRRQTDISWQVTFQKEHCIVVSRARSIFRDKIHVLLDRQEIFVGTMGGFPWHRGSCSFDVDDKKVEVKWLCNQLTGNPKSIVLVEGGSVLRQFGTQEAASGAKVAP